jgi:hypothetical protein
MQIQSCKWIVAVPNANVMSLNMTGDMENGFVCIGNFECKILVYFRF